MSTTAPDDDPLTSGLTVPGPDLGPRHGCGRRWLLHPVGGDGVELDATFEVIPLPVYDLIYHHKAGGRASELSINADYHEGLRLLLTRLAGIHATILGIAVDSSVARQLPQDERELRLDFPIRLGPGTDCAELRLRVTRAQKGVARRPDAKPGGGNDQKRIRITITVDQMGAGRLRDWLTFGVVPDHPVT